MLKSTVEKSKAKKGETKCDGIGKVKFSTGHPEMAEWQEDWTEQGAVCGNLDGRGRLVAGVGKRS